MLAAIAAQHGARHVETLTGFKWLARADLELPACTLVYAYEEAIGYCVDPASVRDKDGISAAVLVCDLAVALRHRGHTLLDALDGLARRHGVHITTAVSRQVANSVEAAAMMDRLRTTPLHALAGFDVTLTDLRHVTGPLRTDAVVFSGGYGQTTIRVVVRPSGTEPKVKCYIEVRCGSADDLGATRLRAAALAAEIRRHVQRW
jgi:phosphomannomutase